MREKNTECSAVAVFHVLSLPRSADTCQKREKIQSSVRQQYRTAQHSTAQHSTKHSTAQSTAQHKAQHKHSTYFGCDLHPSSPLLSNQRGARVKVTTRYKEGDTETRVCTRTNTRNFSHTNRNPFFLP